ncbi:hypothetical protein LTR84_012892 [Exophiala bonariae]|uniref:Carboxylic ester hydrolase n=1 Tax=Exophiala bonariae TaxID=1690606 RepID=A0AAV9NDJ3_9EURO|nr:hypothetical protein LTR84_012892 [Exophiala bonariae]
MWSNVRLITGLLPLLGLVTAQSNFQKQCSDVRAAVAGIPNVTVNIVDFVPGGTNVTFPDNDVTCAASQVVYGGDLCRITMNIATSASSGITLEAWLPVNWTGRFLSVGNGGLNGCISYADLAYAASFGFAAVGANNGHNGTSGKPFLNSPGVVEDFAYRSVHTGVVVGKQVTKLLYGRDHSYSYYLGCSTGGRQGFKSAQSFPNDFDGIVAGAPAFDFNNLNSWGGWQAVLAGFDNTSASFVSLPQWVSVQAEVIRQCDGLDGALDGIIEDPSMCFPKISSLICNATSNTSTCLSGAQATTVKNLFADSYGENGTLFYPRSQPGVEAQVSAIFRAGQMFVYPLEWYRYAIFNDPNWDPSTLTLEDIAYSEEIDLFGISTFDADLSSFNATGGKILHYHGQADPIISSLNSPRYYEKVAANMSLSPSELDEFYRFFRVSGMGHCGGGNGAWDIGNRYTGRPQAASTPEDNVLLAMVEWVEEGKAPESITGYGYGKLPTAGNVTTTRKHCKYPGRNVYVGPGPNTDPSAWKCI